MACRVGLASVGEAALVEVAVVGYNGEEMGTTVVAA